MSQTLWAFKKYGFLAPVGLHFWTDIVWHVLWGIISCHRQAPSAFILPV
jgi:hypothetical protein